MTACAENIECCSIGEALRRHTGKQEVVINEFELD